MAIWEEIKDGSTTFRRPTVKADGTRNQTASELRDIGIRALLGKLPGNLPIMADIGLHLMGPNTDAALEKGKKYLGDVVGGYWKRMGEEPARGTYEALTDLKRGMTPEFAQTTVPNPDQPNWTKKVQGPKLEPGIPKRVPSGRYPEAVADIDPFFNPERVTHDPSQYSEYATRFKGEAPKDQKWAQVLYDNPEVTASVVGATTAAAPLIAGGLALNAFAEGGKPRSSYSNSVDGYDLSDTGSRSSNEYNPSVESAREAARAKTELEKLKHAHAKELIELRGEAGTPGVQGGSSSVGSSGISTDVDRFLSNVYGNRGTTKYF